jgi:hypothetical protein
VYIPAEDERMDDPVCWNCNKKKKIEIAVDIFVFLPCDDFYNNACHYTPENRAKLVRILTPAEKDSMCYVCPLRTIRLSAIMVPCLHCPINWEFGKSVCAEQDEYRMKCFDGDEY